MKIVFFGTSDFGIPALDALKTSSHSLLNIVTAYDKPAGRHLKLEPSPVKSWAMENKIPYLESNKQDLPGALSALKKLDADVFVAISFGVILPGQMLAAPRLAALNVHASLLPRYRGPSPIQTAILNGDLETGVSVMRMVERLDTGDVLLQKKTSILREEDAGSLAKKLSILSATALLESLSLLNDHRALFVPQDEKKVTWTKKINKEDGHIDWSQSASRVQDRMRAMAGWPGSYSFYDGKRLLVIKVRAEEKERSVGPPGTILKASGDEGIQIATEDLPICIETLQAEGRKAMSAKDFLKGFVLKPGSVLE